MSIDRLEVLQTQNRNQFNIKFTLRGHVLNYFFVIK